MWAKYPITRIALRTGTTPFGINKSSTKMDCKYIIPTETHLGMCAKEFTLGCIHAFHTFRNDFVNNNIDNIVTYTTPNIQTLISDQIHGNSRYIQKMKCSNLRTNILDVYVGEGFVQRNHYTMGFIRARDFTDGMYGPEKFILHPCEKRFVWVSYEYDETYSIWQKDMNGEPASEPLHNDTSSVMHAIKFEQDIDVIGGDTIVDTEWVISGINGYE